MKFFRNHEELRAWKNQAKQKQENPLEQPKKASVLEKLHRYQQEGRQQPKRSVKKKSMDIVRDAQVDRTSGARKYAVQILLAYNFAQREANRLPNLL